MKPLSVRQAALLLFIGSVLLYLPAAGFDFINLDDSLVDLALFRDGVWSWEVLRQTVALRDPYPMPLTYLSFLLDSLGQGYGAAAFHRTNLLLHALNSVVLFLIFNALTGQPWRSLLLGILFAVHPQHVEAVAWVINRKGVLSALFALLALLAYARYATSVEKTARPYYLLALISFLFALLSKPEWITLPLLLLLLDGWPLGRIRWATWKGILLEKVPFFVLCLFSFAITRLGSLSEAFMPDAERPPLWDQLGLIPYSYLGYLEKTLLPFQLSPVYPVPQAFAAPMVLGGSLLLLALTWGALRQYATRPWLTVGWLWFFISLLPMSVIVRVLFHPVGMAVAMADRWSYVFHPGLFLALVWSLPHPGPRLRYGMWGAVALVVALLAARTVDQLAHWRNSETLWTHALTVTDPRDNAEIHWLLGTHYGFAGQYDRAYEQLQQAAAKNPDNPSFTLWLGHTRLKQGDRPGAWEHYRHLLDYSPPPQLELLHAGERLLAHRQPREALVLLKRGVVVSVPPKLLSRFLVAMIVAHAYEEQHAAAGESLSLLLGNEPLRLAGCAQLREMESRGDSDSFMPALRRRVCLEP